MNSKILALLFSVVLIGTAGAAQARNDYKFSAPAKQVIAAANNPVLPPLAHQTNRYRHGAIASASRMLDSRRDARGTPMNLAASAVQSWAKKIKTFFESRVIEESCLATAIYFEARSESQEGQLAVATVILNRAKSTHYPSSICGVVYQNASRFNGCQFSFACDGKSDLPKDVRAWEAALAVTALALAGGRKEKNGEMQVVATATHYHADYVAPKWSKSLNRLTKIGRHIFYSQG